MTNRKMEKGKISYFFSAVLFAAAVSLFASCSPELRASVDFSKETASGASSSGQSASGTNFNVGLYDWMYFSKDSEKSGVALNYGLEYIGKGYKENDGADKFTVGLNFLQVPVYGTYRYALSKDLKIYAGAGPFVGYGIGGKVKGGGESISSFGENNGGFKRWDAGATFCAGGQYKMFTLTANYDLGLLNQAYSSDDIKAKSHVFGISVGYSFGGLFKKK